jgi:murein DD-endopeptidase MepM/ murein hydrolase activator NlpD
MAAGKARRSRRADGRWGRWLTRVVIAGGLIFGLAMTIMALREQAEPDPPPPRPTTVAPPPTATEAPTLEPTVPPLEIAAVEYPTALPTDPPRVIEPVDWVQPTADPQLVAQALSQPVDGGSGTLRRNPSPLTILPARSRSEVITYAVQPNDTLQSIAERFGLQQSTIIWSNDRFYVNAMRIGLELNILPVDGVYHRVDEPQTIRSIAEMYEVDPYAIIDSEFNNLYGVTPDVILPEGLFVVVPGGTGSTEPIYWDPGIVMTSGESEVRGSGVVAGTQRALFALGDPGSCGEQIVSGGSAPVNPPIYRNYRITQDYSWTHGGIDLAVPEGTPVFAAGGGTVIFKGWSTWGYGYTVVIAHGGTLSIYGHLNGAFVGCGEVVTPGQNIAVTGNSGRSSGPHLHFEIRGAAGVPVNPWSYQSF